MSRRLNFSVSLRCLTGIIHTRPFKFQPPISERLYEVVYNWANRLNTHLPTFATARQVYSGGRCYGNRATRALNTIQGKNIVRHPSASGVRRDI